VRGVSAVCRALGSAPGASCKPVLVAGGHWQKLEFGFRSNETRSFLLATRLFSTNFRMRLLFVAAAVCLVLCRGAEDQAFQLRQMLKMAPGATHSLPRSTRGLVPHLLGRDTHMYAPMPLTCRPRPTGTTHPTKRCRDRRHRHATGHRARPAHIARRQVVGRSLRASPCRCASVAGEHAPGLVDAAGT